MQKKNLNSSDSFNYGFILHSLFSLFGFIIRLIRNSFFVSLFTDYKSIVKYAKKSKSSLIINIVTGFKHRTIKFKNLFARFSEESIFMNMFDRAGKSFFTTSLRSVGIFLLSGGGLITFACVAQHADRILTLDFSDTFILGCVMTLLSLFFIPQKSKSISECICESSFLSYFFERMFYIKHLEYGKKNDAHTSGASAFILGVAFGSISYAVSPVLALFLIGITLYLYLIFTKPENGVLLICMQLPLLANNLLVFLIAATVLSLIFKVIRGKRSHSVTLCSCSIILLGVLLLSCTAFSFDPAGAFSECLPFIIAIVLTYTVIMTVRSSSLAGKCFRMIGLSTLISVAFGIVNTSTKYISAFTDFERIKSVFSHGFASTFADSESCAAFLIATIPLFLIRHPIKSRIFSFPALSVVILCLFLCNSYHAVLALFMALIISIIIFNRKGFVALVAAALIAGFTSLAFSEFTNNMLKIFIPTLENHADAGFTSYYSLAEFFSHFGFTGVGFGEEAVANASIGYGINASHINSGLGVYTDLSMKLGIPLMFISACLLFVFVSKSVSYALSRYKSEAARSECSAMFTSVCALAIFSLFSDFMHNFRLLALVFLLFGLISATADSADEDFISPDRITEYEIQ